MMTKRLIALAGIVIILLNACQPAQHSKILGTWQGVAVLEENEALEIDPAQIRISFGPEDQYAFSSTLNYREAGSFYLEGEFLYTTDTINQASTEKVVKISLLTADSLFLLMNEGGRERLIKFARQ